VQAGAENPELLNSLECMKVVTQFLRANRAVASSLGHPYQVQLGQIYETMLHVYAHYSSQISAAVSAQVRTMLLLLLLLLVLLLFLPLTLPSLAGGLRHQPQQRPRYAHDQEGDAAAAADVH